MMGAVLAAGAIWLASLPDQADKADGYTIEEMAADIAAADESGRVVRIGCDCDGYTGAGLASYVKDPDSGACTLVTCLHVTAKGVCFLPGSNGTWTMLDRTLKAAVRPDVVIFEAPAPPGLDAAFTWADREPIVGEHVTIFRYDEATEGITRSRTRVRPPETMPTGNVLWGLDAASEPGMSGGPVVAEDGRLLGIITGGAEDADHNGLFLSVGGISGVPIRHRTLAQVRTEYEESFESKRRYDLARELERDGKLEHALDELRPVIEADPDDPLAPAKAAHILLRLGRTDEAIDLLTVPAERHRSNPAVGQMLVLAYRQAGRHDLAGKVTDRLLDAGVADQATATVRFVELVQAGDRTRALAVLNRFIEIHPYECDLYPLQDLRWISQVERTIPPDWCIERDSRCKSIAIDLLYARSDFAGVARIHDEFGCDGLAERYRRAVASALLNLGRVQDGLRAAERAGQELGLNASLALAIGELYRDLTDDDGRAEAYLSMASQLAPPGHKAHIAAAIFAGSAGCGAATVDLMLDRTELLGGDRDDVSLWNVATCFGSTGRDGRALELIASRPFMELGELAELAAVSAWRLGWYDLAVGYGRLALEFNPDQSELRSWIESLDAQIRTRVDE